MNTNRKPQMVTAMHAAITALMGNDFQSAMCASCFLPVNPPIVAEKVLRDSTGNAIGNHSVADEFIATMVLENQMNRH
jgi:hypothetical protein